MSSSPISPCTGGMVGVLLVNRSAHSNTNGSTVNNDNDSITSLRGSSAAVVLRVTTSHGDVGLMSVPHSLVISAPNYRAAGNRVTTRSSIVFGSVFTGNCSRNNSITSTTDYAVGRIGRLDNLSVRGFVIISFNNLIGVVSTVKNISVYVPARVASICAKLGLSPNVRRLANNLTARCTHVHRNANASNSSAVHAAERRCLVERLIGATLSGGCFARADRLCRLTGSTLSSIRVDRNLTGMNALTNLTADLGGFDVSGLCSVAVPVAP